MGTTHADRGHAGADQNAFGATPDSRVEDLLSRAEQSEPLSQTFGFLSDTHRTLHTSLLRLNRTPLRVGRIIHAIPGLNWYKVQVSAGPSLGCCMLGEGSFANIGVRPTSPAGPNNLVLVWIPPGLPFGIILGLIPPQIANGEINIPDWIQQGGNTGFKREKTHKYPVQAMFRQGGVMDFSNRRPTDSTALEWGRMSESGVGILIDSFQAFLRVSEVCGLFLNYWDQHCRLTALNHDFHSMARQLQIRYDEGENLLIQHDMVYPWEAVGCYSPGETWTKESDDREVQYTKCKGKIDLPDGEEDLEPFSRYIEYGGYLGQPRMSLLRAPEVLQGRRHLHDDSKDFGLWQQSLSLDGTFSMRSAKSIYFGHHVLIPVPKRKHLPEDQKTGDDSRKDNYKFSSKFGNGGAEHKVGDIKVDGELKHLRRVAGIQDVLAHTRNWKSLHPFHYHSNDYKAWQELEITSSSRFDRAQDHLQFDELVSQEYMSFPSPRQVQVDHRYGKVDYYQRESFCALHEDGSVHLGCGYGAQIVLTGGDIILDCPGNIFMMSGKRIVQLTGESITRAKGSVDISSSTKDVRVKAQGNLQMLAGNGGTGGLLLECRSEGVGQDYKDKVGEEANGSGITLLTKHSGVNLLGREIYLRTGGENLDNGPITLDAAKGSESISLYGQAIDIYAGVALQVWHTPSGESMQPEAAHRFGKDNSVISGNLMIEKNVIITSGELAVSGPILSGDQVVATTTLVQREPGFVNGHKGKFDLKPTTAEAEKNRQKYVQDGADRFTAAIVKNWYGENRPGEEKTLKNIGFSYRDPPQAGQQYRTADCKLPEPRWQQMVRTGMGSGGQVWKEKAVTYQGRDTYPWPGKAKWCDEQTLLQYSCILVMPESGTARDRGKLYESPQLANWELAIPNTTFRTII